MPTRVAPTKTRRYKQPAWYYDAPMRWLFAGHRSGKFSITMLERWMSVRTGVASSSEFAEGYSVKDGQDAKCPDWRLRSRPRTKRRDSRPPARDYAPERLRQCGEAKFPPRCLLSDRGR